jgi:hypothetical protein
MCNAGHAWGQHACCVSSRLSNACGELGIVGFGLAAVTGCHTAMQPCSMQACRAITLLNLVDLFSACHVLAVSRMRGSVL